VTALGDGRVDGEIETRLRAVTFNYSTVDDATRAVRLASLIAALFEPVPAMGVVDRRLGAETTIARRIEELSTRLPFADNGLRAQADQLVRRLDAVQRVAAKHGILIEDVGITLEHRRALRFVREGWLLAVEACRAQGGWIIGPPRRASVAMVRRLRGDPAMRTLVTGAVFVLLTYLADRRSRGGLESAGRRRVSRQPADRVTSLYLSDRLSRAVSRARGSLPSRSEPPAADGRVHRSHRRAGVRPRATIGCPSPAELSIDAWRQILRRIGGGIGNPAGARVFQRFELQALGIDTDCGAIAQEQIFIGRDEVRERAAFPFVPV
jgi:hypothetical protein